MKILRTTDRNFRYDFGKVYKNRMEVPESIHKTVASILDDVARIGDEALFKYTEKFDACVLNVKTLELNRRDWKLAAGQVPAKEIKALKLAHKRIQDFAKKQILNSWEQSKEGVTLGLRYLPLERVGIYIPGGKAAYPSSVLMTATIARAAGVGEIIMCSPFPNGEINPGVLAAADVAGVNRIFKIGGAQAIAAMAYGTKTIPKVDKIVGPGNVYVTLAKKLVFGTVDIDMVAGPSEVCVLADGEIPASYIAADLLAQAEHDEMACPLLITDNSNYASRVEGEVRIQLSRLRRKAIASVAIQKRALIVLVRSLEEGIDLVNEIAPEHLELALKNPRVILEKIRHAGAVFIGSHTPETMGDYLAGPSHVLPTNGTARFFSLLRAHDFQKSMSVIEMSETAFKSLAPEAIRLAEMEGLTAHARAVEIRME